MGLDGCVRILKELFVRRRGIRLRTDRIGLSLLRLVDYGLDHPNDAVAAFVLVVLLEVFRRWRGLRARVRRRGGANLGEDKVSSETSLAVSLLHAVEREREDLLRRALVGDGLLELGVLRLPILARAGHLKLRVLDLSVGGRELFLQRVQGRRQGLDLGGQVRHGVLTEDSLLLVLVELRDAEVLLLHVVLLLLLELFRHLFNLLLDLLESLECDRRRHCDEHLAAGALRGRPQRRGGRAPPRPLRGDRDLHEGDRLAEELVGLVGVEDGDRLGHALQLQVPSLRPRLELRVGVRATDLEVRDELLVGREGVLRVREVLLRRGEILLCLRELLGLGVDHLLPRSNLRELARLDLLEVRHGLRLLLLRLGEVRLEGLLHLLEDPEDLPARGSVGLEARRLLEERRDLFTLGGGEARAVQHPRGDEMRDLNGGRELKEGGVVLRERRHGPVQRRDGRDEVLLVLVELGEVLLAHSVRLPESGVVLRDLVLKRRDLTLELRGLACEAFNVALEALDLRGRGRDRGLFVRAVGVAPARKLVVKLLVSVLLFRELRLHLL